MKKHFILMWFLIALTTNLVSAVDLKYKWKAGSVYRFKYSATDNINMSMNLMGMSNKMNDVFKTDMTFSIKIKAVNAAGTADAVIFVESFKITNKAGATVGSLAGIPAEALSSPVEITNKGQFTYKKYVYVIVQETGNLVCSGKVNPNGASASATGPDGTQVNLHAEFDPKTGTLKAGYSVTTVAQPKTKKIVIKENASQLDLLPYDFLQIFTLPDGDIKAGQTANVKTAGMKVDIAVTSITNNVAISNIKFTSDMKGSFTEKQNTSIQSNEPSNGGDNDMGDMSNGMGDMNSMNMNTNTNTSAMDMGMGNDQLGAVPDVKTNGDVTLTFDNNSGMFTSATGKTTSKLETSGIKNDAVTNMTLTYIPPKK